MALAQQIPGVPVALKRHSRYTLKNLRYRDSGQILTFREWQNLGLFEPDQELYWDIFSNYIEQGLEVIDNTAEEITDLADEMLDQLEGLEPDAESVRLQNLFIERFVSHLPDIEYAPKISARFALRHRVLIES